MLLQVPVLGSYSSAETRGMTEPAELTLPPATRTWPVGRRMAVWLSRAVAIPPVSLQVPVLGSYNSAEARVPAMPVCPPVTRTLPLGSGVAVWPIRAAAKLPVVLQVPVVGLYNSAEARRLIALPPPATRT